MTHTNTIEAHNRFAKWLFFGGDVVAANDPYEQQKQLRYSDLITACVIVQNTADMSRALEQLEAMRQGDSPEVRHLTRGRLE